MSRVVLITGAGGGIGSITATQFAQAGDTVIVSDINAESASAVALALCEAAGDTTRAIALPADVSDRGSVEALFDNIRERFGRLDCAFNNAGIGGGGAPLLDTDDAIWDACVSINLTSTGLFLPCLLQTFGQLA